MQRHLRLRRREDFARLREHGRTWRHPFLVLSATPNDRPHNRYGFITSKHLGNAVVRNRVRRLLREAVRQAHPHVQPGHDIVLIARKPIVGQTYHTVYKAVINTLNSAGLMHASPEEPPT